MKLDPTKLLTLKVPSAGAAKVGEPIGNLAKS